MAALHLDDTCPVREEAHEHLRQLKRSRAFESEDTDDFTATNRQTYVVPLSGATQPLHLKCRRLCAFKSVIKLPAQTGQIPTHHQSYQRVLA
jgi:hypothetical protein